MALRFVINHFESEVPEYEGLSSIDVDGYSNLSQDLISEYDVIRVWSSQFIKGEPKATIKSTVEELKAMGIAGLYREVPDEASDNVSNDSATTNS